MSPNFKVLTFPISQAIEKQASDTTLALPRQVPETPAMVNAASAAVYAAWLPHVGHAEAKAEAERFARHFPIAIDGPLAPLPAEAELDATLAAVAEAMK